MSSNKFVMWKLSLRSWRALLLFSDPKTHACRTPSWVSACPTEFHPVQPELCRKMRGVLRGASAKRQPRPCASHWSGLPCVQCRAPRSKPSSLRRRPAQNRWLRPSRSTACTLQHKSVCNTAGMGAVHGTAGRASASMHPACTIFSPTCQPVGTKCFSRSCGAQQGCLQGAAADSA